MILKNKNFYALIMMMLTGCFLLTGCGKKAAEVEEATEVAVVEAEPVPEEEVNALVENDHGSVDLVVKKYLDCTVTGDVEALEVFVDEISEEDKERLISRSTVYKGYENLKCYVKDGPEEDSYIAYLRYDMVFAESIGVKTAVPDIQCIYISPKNDDGQRHIRYSNVENDMELQAYVEELEKDPNVIALYDDVKASFQEALESDEALYNFIQDVTSKSAEAEDEPAQEETAAEEPAEEEAEEPAEGTAQNRETRVLDSVNIRREPSTDAERMAVAYPGDKITQIESYADGWSKVEYKGVTGYIKTEYIE